MKTEALRSLEEAVVDLIEQLDRLPQDHPDRRRLGHMICVLEAEIALRAARDT